MVESRAYSLRFVFLFAVVTALFASASPAAVNAATRGGADRAIAKATFRDYACAASLKHGAPAHATTIGSATLDDFGAVLLSRPTTNGFVASPSLRLSYGGKSIGSYQLLADSPDEELSAIDLLTSRWTPTLAFTSPNSFLCLARFSAWKGLVALVALTEPGANQCCEFLDLFNLASSGGYGFAEPIGVVNLGPEAPVSLVQEPYTTLLITADTEFFGRFSDDADSVSPVRVMQIGQYGLENVTAAWPDFVRTDAAAWLSIWTKPSNRTNPLSRGPLAAWAADECVLGEGGSALRRVAQAAEREGSGNGLPRPTEFVAQLKSFLKTQGYTC